MILRLFLHFPNFIYLFNFFSVAAFVAKLVMGEDTQMENVNTSPKSKDMEGIVESDVGVDRDFCALDVNNKGIAYVPNLVIELVL
jgi:hypothetical protein